MLHVKVNVWYDVEALYLGGIKTKERSHWTESKYVSAPHLNTEHLLKLPEKQPESCLK